MGAKKQLRKAAKDVVRAAILLRRIELRAESSAGDVVRLRENLDEALRLWGIESVKRDVHRLKKKLGKAKR